MNLPRFVLATFAALLLFIVIAAQTQRRGATSRPPIQKPAASPAPTAAPSPTPKADPASPSVAIIEGTAISASDIEGDVSAAIMRDAARRIARTPPALETFAVDEQDWVRVTQAQFQPIAVGADMWIVPTWCRAPRADALNITLDPGLAFGTGAHATTRLCLLWLRQHVEPGISLLDYGCGSGILAIAAAKLGARRVVGTDIDPQAVRSSIDNARANGIDAAFVTADTLAPGRFDLVVANILANPLRILAPALAARVAPGGRIALAGILAGQAPQVADAYAPWFDIGSWRSDDGWVLLAGSRLPERASGSTDE